MSTLTFSAELDQLSVIITIPSHRPLADRRNKVAIMLAVNPRDVARPPMGSYIYSIYDPKRDQVHQTILNNSEEVLLDMTKRLGMIVTKKYKTPSYVCINTGQIDPLEFTSVVTGIVDAIEAKYKEREEKGKKEGVVSGGQEQEK